MALHNPTPRLASRPARLLGWVAAVLALLAVFALYTAPGFMVMLSDQLWACF
ncbi:hypothetical protein [Acidovorax sp.]|uniref:hypothetical protein n=1 Tax=Acidovorax sp. TaxID=1872122 RepID=UPI002582B36F|nr:hypothetical protein [Acidovorax sp.]